MGEPTGAATLQTFPRVRSDMDFEANPAVTRRAAQEAHKGDDEAGEAFFRHVGSQGGRCRKRVWDPGKGRNAHLSCP
eukprot:6403509-Pyramimonas_sp.AAC.1